MRSCSLLLLTLAASLPLAAAADDQKPGKAPSSTAVVKMKFNEVKEVAPGVFFRYSSISPTDPSVFGGSNNIWVVFEDYVAVIDANFPKEAEDVLAAIKKTTDKPVRYVLDTHHHGDHAWGNAVWVKAGATIVSSRKCARLLKETGPAEFAAAGKGPAGRKDVAASTLKVPTLIFDSKLVLDDGKQRVEFYAFGHSHTVGDAVAYLPKHRMLCTGDACVNGPYNYMGQSDSASWVRCLEKMEQLDVRLVLPGHGLPMGKGLLANQKRYFQDLRREVKKAIDAGKDIDDVVKAIDLPWYKEWTTVKPAVDNIKHVYNEYMGLVGPAGLEEDLGIYAGPSPTKETKGWTKPKRIVVQASLAPARLRELKKVAPEVEFLPAKSPEEAAKLAADADAVLGFATEKVMAAGTKLRWVQGGATALSSGLTRAHVTGGVTLTDGRRVVGPAVAEQTFALILALTRDLLGKGKMPPVELRGKTMLLVGLSGGTGAEIARRASAFGMRVRALDDAAKERPAGVFSLERLDQLTARLPEADVVVLALPFSGDEGMGLIGEKQLKAMKKGSFLVNAASPWLIDLEALAKELSSKGRKARGVALDVTGWAVPKELSSLKAAGLVLVEAQPSRVGPEAQARLWRLYRENVRRFAAGEPLLGVVGK